MRLLSDREEMKVVAAYIVVYIVWGSTYLGIRIVTISAGAVFRYQEPVAGSILMYRRSGA